MPHGAPSMAEFARVHVWQNVRSVKLAEFAPLLAFLRLESLSYFYLGI